MVSAGISNFVAPSNAEAMMVTFPPVVSAGAGGSVRTKANNGSGGGGIAATLVTQTPSWAVRSGAQPALALSPIRHTLCLAAPHWLFGKQMSLNSTRPSLQDLRPAIAQARSPAAPHLKHI